MSIDVMKQALEALESSRIFVTSREKIKHPEGTELYDNAITALRAAIEQAPWVKSYAGGKPNYTEPQERKPVAWRKYYENSGYTYFDERWKTIPNDAEPLFSN